MKTTFMDIINNYKNEFETKWDMNINTYPEETMFWASRNKDFNDVAMFMAIRDGKLIYVNKENLEQSCFDDFCEVINEYSIIKSIVETAKEKNSDLTEEDLVNTYLITRHIPRPGFN